MGCLKVKRAVAVLIGLLFILSLAGCGGGDKKASDQSKPIVMKFVHGYSESVPHHRYVLKFKELAEKHTGGRLQVRVYGGAQLGPINTEFDMLRNGVADANFTVCSMVETIDPAEGVYQVPFLVNAEYPGDMRIVKLLATSKVEEILKKRQAKLGLYRLGNFPTNTGFFITGNNLRPVKTPEDAAGLKLRHPGGIQVPILFEALKISPVSIATAEVAVALAQGVVDGQATAPMQQHASKTDTKYMTLPLSSNYTTPLFISMNFWNKLPPDIQEIIEKKVKPELYEYAYAEGEKSEKTAMKEIQEPPINMQIDYWNMKDPKIKAFTEQVREKGIAKLIQLAGEEDGKALVEEAKKMRATLSY